MKQDNEQDNTTPLKMASDQDIINDKKKAIEEDYNGTLISFEEFQKITELANWLKSIVPYENMNDYLQIFSRLSNGKQRYSIKLYTTGYIISINIRLPEDLPKDKNDRGYIGGFLKCRKSLPGETHHRGSDLHDGKFKKETFDELVNDVLKTQLVELDDNAKFFD